MKAIIVHRNHSLIYHKDGQVTKKHRSLRNGLTVTQGPVTLSKSCPDARFSCDRPTYPIGLLTLQLFGELLPSIGADEPRVGPDARAGDQRLLQPVHHLGHLRTRSVAGVSGRTPGRHVAEMPK